MDVRAQMLFFSRILSTLTEVLGRDIRANDPRMSAGYPSPKLTLWADFSFLSVVGNRRFKGEEGKTWERGGEGGRRGEEEVEGGKRRA